MNAFEFQPIAVDATADTVDIEWSDGVKHEIDNRVLRGNCPCASCNDVREAGNRITVSAGVRANKLWLVGGYALGFEWSDGHHDGMFSFRLLRDLGQACEAHREAPPAGA